MAVFFIVYCQILSIWFDTKMYLTQDFKDLGPLMKMWYLFWGLHLMMTTYITGFYLMDAGPVAAGFAYNEVKDGKVCHDRIKSIDAWKLFTAMKVKDFLANWNISVHEWLKHYVYLRQLSNNKRGGNNLRVAMLTFFVSAIWHGFYPGFLVFFFGAGMMDYQNKLQE